MKLAVVGAGGWGRNLVRTLHEIGALAAVVEIDPACRNEVAAAYDVAVFERLEDALGEDIQAFVVATPAVTHHDVARRILLADRDVFVEKPLSMTVGDAEDLVRTAAQRQRILMAGHMLLYQPAVTWIAEFLSADSIGRVHSYHQDRLNLGRARSFENALWSLGVHDIAVLLHLAGGAPRKTVAWGQNVLQGNIEDDVHVHMEFADDLQAHLHASWLWPEKERRLTVIGSEAMLVYDEVAQSVFLHKKGIRGNLSLWNRGKELVFQGAGEPLRLELEHFIACVADRTLPLSDGASAVEVMHVLEDASAALEENRVKAMIDG